MSFTTCRRSLLRLLLWAMMHGILSPIERSFANTRLFAPMHHSAPIPGVQSL